MSNIYFILKNSALTLVVVSLLQFQMGSQTLEDHLMHQIRKNIAPKFLGREPSSIRELDFKQEEIEALKNKVLEKIPYQQMSQKAQKLLISEIKRSLAKSNTQEKEEGEKETLD